MKIDPKYYPVILLLAFTIGTLATFLIGFRPKHEGNNERGRSESPMIVLVHRVGTGSEL